MSKIVSYIVIIFTLLLSCNIYSQVAEISVRVEKDSLMIGEQTKLKVQVIKDKQANVVLPVFSDTLVKNIEILSCGEIDTIRKGKEETIFQYYTISSFDTAYYNIPSFPFPVSFGEIRDTLFSSPFQINVSVPEVDLSTEYRDIKAPVNTPLNMREMLPYIIAGLVSLFILTFLYRFIRKMRQKQKPVFLEENTIPPFIVALRKLKEMVEEEAWEKENIKEFYTRLSEIVRIYLEAQFKVNALESTTREILLSFETAFGKNSEIRNKLENLLQLSDLVKFAKEAPLPSENKSNLDKAIEFVELTKPAVTESVEKKLDNKKEIVQEKEK